MEAVAPLPEVSPVELQAPPAAVDSPRAVELPVVPAMPRRESLLVHIALLLAITALGGVLRFICLDRPPIWGDEGATFVRVCGTFYELMDRLQSAGFAPLHYELYWWIGQHTLLTPFMMRLVPAITGTLMIPAMYWLSSQLIGRRAALLTALLTATSAYLLNYSRDAKMYSPFWFLAVVNVASLLWWLRVRTPTSWCVWLASGTAMVGVDALGWLTVVIELLIVLLAPRGNWLSLPRLALLLLSSVLVWSMSLGILVLPVLIAAHELAGQFKGVAIAVIFIALLRLLCQAIAFVLRRRGSKAAEIGQILGWASERVFFRPLVIRWTSRFCWPPVALFLFGLAIMAAGPVGYYYDFNRFLQRVDERGWGGTGIDWVDRYNYGRSGPSLVGFTASAFLTSWEWPREADMGEVAPRTLRLLTAGVISIAAALALGLFPWPWARSMKPDPALGGWRAAMWVMLWLVLPPYGFYCVSVKDHVGPDTWLIAARDFVHAGPWWINAGLTVVALGWLWMAGRTWPERLLRVFLFAAIVAVTLGITEAIFLVYPKLDATLSAGSAGWREHGSVWMPRYVGVVLPAVLIIVTALLWRLPTRPLRWGAVLLFVIVNLSVHGARVFAGTEQPTGLIARDILDSQKSDAGDGAFRAYFQSSMQAFGAEPGSVALRSASMRYYITILSPRGTPPNEMVESQLNYRIRPGRSFWMSFTGYIINEVRRSPKLQTFVTWERIEPHDIDMSDKILDALQPGWRLAGEETFAVREHWRWIDTCTLRRRVYVRTASGLP